MKHVSGRVGGYGVHKAVGFLLPTAEQDWKFMTVKWNFYPFHFSFQFTVIIPDHLPSL